MAHAPAVQVVLGKQRWRAAWQLQQARLLTLARSMVPRHGGAAGDADRRVDMQLLSNSTGNFHVSVQLVLSMKSK